VRLLRAAAEVPEAEEAADEDRAKAAIKPKALHSRVAIKPRVPRPIKLRAAVGEDGRRLPRVSLGSLACLATCLSSR
jgi:hypothetical protein